MASFNLVVMTMNAGREAIAQQLVDGEPAIQIVGFSVGEGGYDPGDPATAIAIDPSDSLLVSQIFPVSGYEPYDATEWVNAFTPVIVCKLENSEGIGSLGEIGIWAQYVTGPSAGSDFLYAKAHFPLKVKTPYDAPTWRLAFPH